MIFFIILKNNKPKFDLITDPKNVHKIGQVEYLGDEYELVAWNEVYGSSGELRKAVMQVVEVDPVCLDLIAQARMEFGIDVLDPNEPIAARSLDRVFKFWPHPMIGNIFNSPNARRVEGEQQMAANWDKFHGLSKDTREAIKTLMQNTEESPKLTSAARDQVRICFNIVELARAIIGEVTCAATKRLEKLLALRLCRSPKLLAAQRSMLQQLWGREKGKIIGIVAAKWNTLEYTKYYLRLNAKDSSLMHKLVPSMFALATDPTPQPLPQQEGRVTECLNVWCALPPQIRCAALINDFRKLLGSKNPPKKTLQAKALQSLLAPGGGKVDSGAASNYTLGKPIGNHHVPTLYVEPYKGKGRRPRDFKAWSWNRNECHSATVTYRHHLCPLWGGSSGHTGGGLEFWRRKVGETKGCANTWPTTVACSLFIIWRLYYDKRISPVHTMTETFESTLIELVTGTKEPVFRYFQEGETGELKPKMDALDFVKLSCVQASTDNEAIDPICMMKMMKLWAYPKKDDDLASYVQLKELIDVERQALDSEYWMPQWAHQLAFRTEIKAGQGIARHAQNTARRGMEALVLEHTDADDPNYPRDQDAVAVDNRLGHGRYGMKRAPDRNVAGKRPTFLEDSSASEGEPNVCVICEGPVFIACSKCGALLCSVHTDVNCCDL